MKIVGGDTFCSYYILYQYFKNSPKIQKWSDRQTRLSKDNGPASKEHNETHNECMLHFHKFHKVLYNKKSNQITTREAAHKIRQLQINIRNLSWTSEVYPENIFKNVFKNLKPRCCSKPCMILKRPDENCSRCNLKLLYIISLFQNFKNLPKIYATVKPNTSRNAYIL